MSQDNGFQFDNSNGDTPLPIDEKLSIKVSVDKLEAIGVFRPCSNGGNTLSGKDIIKELEKAGIKNGVISSNIEDYLNNRQYGTGVLLAKGTAPIASKDAEIHYTFGTDKEKKPKENEDGSVDFGQLDIINHVYTEDLLAVLTPAYEGEAGMDVYGKLTRPKSPKRLTLKYGKNVKISEDKCKLYAETDGYVDLDGDKVFVSEEYEVSGDVSTATGNIQFGGSVKIKGNVHTGYTVDAVGDIYVEGVVEGATLISGGQIILSRGVQGGNKAFLQARGNIVAKFIEGSVVEAGGYVTAGAILHSKVSAKGDITVGQKKGLVVGGELSSGTLISVKTAGSESYGTNTLLEVGLSPEIMKEFRQLEKEIVDKQKELKKLQQVLDLLKRKMNSEEGLPDEKKSLLQTVTKQVIILTTETKQRMDEYSLLKYKIDNYSAGRIKVENTIYPGVKIVISNTAYYVRSSMQYCQFVKEGNTVKFVPY